MLVMNVTMTPLKEAELKWIPLWPWIVTSSGPVLTTRNIFAQGMELNEKLFSMKFANILVRMPLVAQAVMNKYATPLASEGKCIALTSPCRDVLGFGSRLIALSQRYGLPLEDW
jgi:hypothetical protein